MQKEETNENQSSNTNNQKCKKKTSTNDKTNIFTLSPYDVFSRGLGRSMKRKPDAC